MKIKLWQLEYDFDKEDARIVVPLVLVVLGLWLTPMNKVALLGGATAYYLLYFFLAEIRKHLWAPIHQWLFYRCAYCKSRDVFLQGYQGFHSDEFYAYHLCHRCGNTSIELRNNKLVKAQLKAPK